jgi:hypothetical protein
MRRLVAMLAIALAGGLAAAAMWIWWAGGAPWAASAQEER